MRRPDVDTHASDRTSSRRSLAGGALGLGAPPTPLRPERVKAVPRRTRGISTMQLLTIVCFRLFDTAGAARRRSFRAARPASDRAAFGRAARRSNPRPSGSIVATTLVLFSGLTVGIATRERSKLLADLVPQGLPWRVVKFAGLHVPQSPVEKPIANTNRQWAGMVTPPD